MTYVISGFSSMIGYALSRVIPDECKIIGLVRNIKSVPQEIRIKDNLQLIGCDLSNYKNLDISSEADAFIHLAWMSTTGDGRENLREQIKNIEYSIDAVDLANSLNCRSFIGVGSQAEFGIKNEPLNSKTPPDPLSGYGIAKYTAGKITVKQCEKYSMKSNWVRLLSVYGEYDNPNSFISYLVNTLNKNISPTVSSCEQIWDYLHCDDCARAIIKVAEKGENKKSYVIGSGEKRRLIEYAQEVNRIVNNKIKIKFGERNYNSFQPMYICADIHELQDDTGFSPAVSFSEGIKRFTDFIRRKE